MEEEKQVFTKVFTGLRQYRGVATDLWRCERCDGLVAITSHKLHAKGWYRPQAQLEAEALARYREHRCSVLRARVGSRIHTANPTATTCEE